MILAQRGMLVVVERIHTSTTINFKRSEWSDYVAGVVTGVQDHVATHARILDGHTIALNTSEYPRWWVVSGVPRGVEVIGKLPKRFRDLESARDLIRPFCNG